jgi:hypothetical protein
VSKKLNIEFIRAKFAEEDYVLLTETYDNAHQKLEYICPEGHRHYVRWTNWNSSKKVRCPYCVGNAKLNIEFIRAEFAKEDYELLTKTYENEHQKLEYICPRGHKHSVSWNNWQQGKRCPCFSNNIKPTIEFIRVKFAEEGYILLTEVYENNEQRLEYICSGPEKHRHRITWGNWIKGTRCPFCNNTGISKWEKEVKSFISESSIDYIPNDRTHVVNPDTGCFLELDLWFPKLDKAIECNGVYWHSKEQIIKHDKVKKLFCKDQRIDLLILTDKEWTNAQEKCQTDILSFLESK